jgi:hypothetical protein
MVSRLLLIRLFQPKPDILGVVEASTTTAGGDLKQPDKQEPTKIHRVPELISEASGVVRAEKVFSSLLRCRKRQP